MADPILLIRRFPYRDEGPQGYFLRLAEANFLTLRDLEALDIHFTAISLQRNSLMPSEALDPDLYVYVDRINGFADKIGRSLNRQSARFCPLCLEVAPSWQATWEFLFHDACPEHGIWLVDQCSSCGSVLRWDREHLLRCPCGADLRAEVSRACPHSVQRLSAELASALFGKPVDPDLELPQLRGMGVVEIQRLVRFLGSYLDPAASAKPLKRHRAAKMSASWPVTSLAAEILQDWPRAFDASLSKMQGPPREDKLGLGGFLHHANYYFYHGLRGAAFDWVRDSFEVWLAEHWKGGLNKRNRRLTAEILANVQWVPGGVASDKLGVSPTRLRCLIREGKLDGQESVSTKGRHFLTVRRDQLDQISVQLASEMTMQSAMEALGIGKVRMQRLLRLLFPSARRIYDKVYLPWCVPRAEVEALTAIGNHLPVVGIPDEHQVSLAHIFRYWNWNADEIVALVEAVKAGAITPLALLDSALGIGRWVFEAAQIRAWLLKQSSERSNWVSIPEAARVLGVKQQVAYWLTQNGYIIVERLGSLKGLGSRMRREDLDRFRQDYVFGRDIAAILGRSPKKVMGMLAEQGIYPLRGHGAEPCRQLVYARADEIQRFLSTVTGSPPEEFRLVRSPGSEDDGN